MDRVRQSRLLRCSLRVHARESLGVRAELVLLALAAVAFIASRTERGRAVAADVVGGIVKAVTPRGIRNNNPGNIEWISDLARRWRGMVNKDGRYGVFDTP